MRSRLVSLKRRSVWMPTRQPLVSTKRQLDFKSEMDAMTELENEV